MKYANSVQLNVVTSNLPVIALALPNGVPVTTVGVQVQENTGFFVLTVIENKAGGLGNVDIYAQYSDDGITFNRAYASDMAGNLVQDGNIVSAIGNATRRIVFTARLGKYINFVFSPNTDSQITATLTFQEEDN